MEYQWFLQKFEAFVGVNPWTMLFAWLNLLILYLFLKKLAFKPLKKMIDSRQEEIDVMYSDAEASKVDAENMKAEYEKTLSRATEDSAAIVKNAQRSAQLREEEILRKASEEAARTIERAEEQIELEKKNALNQVKNEVTEIAISIASAVIERDVKADEHRDLIDDFIGNMGDEV